MNSIRAFREKVGLSREDTAEKLHIHEESLARYERGTRDPVGALLKKMALLFGCSVDDLLNPTPPSAEEPGADAERTA